MNKRGRSGKKLKFLFDLKSKISSIKKSFKTDEKKKGGL
jgi:hypothetical protein